MTTEEELLQVVGMLEGLIRRTKDTLPEQELIELKAAYADLAFVHQKLVLCGSEREVKK